VFLSSGKYLHRFGQKILILGLALPLGIDALQNAFCSIFGVLIKHKVFVQLVCLVFERQRVVPSSVKTILYKRK